MLTEQCLYKMLMRSRKPIAEQFQDCDIFVYHYNKKMIFFNI